MYGGYAVAFVVVAAAQVVHLDPLLRFVLAVVALAGGAIAVAEAVDRLSERLSPAATGVVQSVLGNLPELFLAIFALQAGLIGVVAAALIGSVLGNALFVLGLALLAGGLKHGVLTFSKAANRLYATELLLGVAALLVPFLATRPSEPDIGHEVELSAIVSIVLLAIFAMSVPIAIRMSQAGPGARPAASEAEETDQAREADEGAGVADEPAAHGRRQPLSLTLVLLGLSAAAAAFVADWFVEALGPAMASIGMSEAFAGLIVVALAGNAVENVAGITAAYRGRGDLAMSLILNSALQVVLFLAPVIVLLSLFIAPVPLTLIVDPLLLGTLAVTAILVFAIVLDGEANALEGAMLLGLYVIIAAGVWWGPAIAP
ncbi:MAG: sodium:proton exchanger [Chloroflexi bacterium]|nr:sodium:proton exchanger [Chloroflexota bacterium]